MRSDRDLEVILVEPLLDADGVATLLGITRDRVYDLAAARDPRRSLTGIRIGRTLRFRLADVQAFVDRNVSDMVLVST